MLDILANITFRKLFAAQVIALLGTGLATVALALLAYDLAGAQAGEVLGLALAIKMIVYVLLSPVSGAVVPPERRKVVLICLDIIRALVVLALPFVTQIWQIYVLIGTTTNWKRCSKHRAMQAPRRRATCCCACRTKSRRCSATGCRPTCPIAPRT